MPVTFSGVTKMNAPAKKSEPVVETVTMQDGRIVEFAGKRKLQKESFVTAEGAVQVRLDFRNGETRLFTLPPAMVSKFAAHGAEQKLGDEIAGLDDIEDCVLATDTLIDRLYNGEWSVKREANGMAGTSVLVRALVEHTGKTVEAIKAFLANKSQAEKVALRSNPKIKPIVERIEAEKAAKKTNINTDTMLDELA
jgi:hypothetical protein